MSTVPANHATPLPAPTSLEETALAWFARCQRGLSDEQDAEFQAWLTADPRHAALFNEFGGTWELMDRAEALASPANSMPARRRWSATLVRLGLPLAAAAALAVAYVGWWRPAHYSAETVTEIGALRTLRLPDGSVVTLNTHSAVGIAFTPGERRLKLGRGEAYFAVAKDPARPFMVEAGGIVVRAVGTAFNIRVADRAVEVLVTEGKVRVDDAASGRSVLARNPGLDTATLGEPVLGTGGRIVVTMPEPVAKIETPRPVATIATASADEMQRELAWQDRRLDFELASLAEIVAEFNRYSRHRLILADPELAQKRFGGSFRSDDQAGFVRMLRENYGVRVEESESATVLRAAR